jgi:hypothetical protein
MAFALILPSSRSWLDGSATDADADARADADEARRVAVLLRRDYERWSRWALGLGAFAATVVGVFVTGGMLGAIADLGGAVAAVDVVVIVSAVAIALAGGFLLVRLWLTGRALAAAAAAWLRVPYRTGAAVRRGGGWVLARTVNFDPPIFARLTTATLAFLLAIAGVALMIRDIAGGSFGALSATAGLVGLIALVCGIGQTGGVMRIVSGMSEADPLWTRIRSVFLRG